MVRPTLFLSDAHLSVERPAQIAMFREVLARAAALGAEVYILGDLVEFWLGDDDDAPTMRTVVAALAEYSAAGGALKVSLGNRDFLFGERFCAETGATLLPDYLTVPLYGQSVLLTHGDLLCTRDLKYQAFRGYVRDPQNQQKFLGAPLAQRRQIAAQMREGTQASMLEKNDDIMDVDEDEVQQVMLAQGATILIHGHTHRPAVHALSFPDGQPGLRYVLGDWYHTGTVLWVENGTYRLLSTTEFVHPHGVISAEPSL